MICIASERVSPTSDRSCIVKSDDTHLSDKVSVESEADISGVTPVDDGDAGPVGGHVQSFDDPLDEVQHVAPSLGVHRAGGIQHEYEIYQSAAS